MPLSVYFLHQGFSAGIRAASFKPQFKTVNYNNSTYRNKALPAIGVMSVQTLLSSGDLDISAEANLILFVYFFNLFRND